MKTMSIEENDEKLIYEKEIAELVRLVFEKARKDSMGTSKNACGNFIEDNSNLKSKTFVRMYDRYILGNESKSVASMFSLNSASEFLGYKDFADFCREVFSEQELIPKAKNINEDLGFEKIQIPQKNNFRKAIAGIGITTVLGLGSYFGLSSVAEPQCMYWNETRYEKISCEENLHPTIEKEIYDEQLLTHFYQLEITDTTTFFEYGKPIVWYIKVDGKIEFYSAPGNHPLTGKQLKPVTHYIVNKYVID